MDPKEIFKSCLMDIEDKLEELEESAASVLNDIANVRSDMRHLKNAYKLINPDYVDEDDEDSDDD